VKGKIVFTFRISLETKKCGIEVEKKVHIRGLIFDDFFSNPIWEDKFSQNTRKNDLSHW